MDRGAPRRGRAPRSADGERLDFRTVARRRTRIGFALTAAVFVVYFGFILAVAFARPVLGRLVAPGLSLGILLGALVIVAAWLLTLLYVHWANTRYDPALRALRREL